MKFLEAMQAAIEGKRVKNWDGNAVYFIKEGRLMCQTATRNYVEGEYDIDSEEICSDWEIDVEKYSFTEAVEYMANSGNKMKMEGSDTEIAMICGELSYWDIDDWKTLAVTMAVLEAKFYEV